MIADDSADTIIGKLRNLDDVHPQLLRAFADWVADKWADLEREQAARAEAGRQRDVIFARLVEVEEELTRTQSDLTEARRTLSQLLLVHLRQPNERTARALDTPRTAGLL